MPALPGQSPGTVRLAALPTARARYAVWPAPAVLRLVGHAHAHAALALPDVRTHAYAGAQPSWRTAPVTKRTLFTRLCELADALQEECVRVDFSPHKLALEAITERIDALIDEVLDEGVHDEEPAPS